MSKTNNRHKGGGRQRNISVRAVRREQPDLRKLSRALIQMAMAQAAAEAEAQESHVQQPTAEKGDGADD